MEINSTVKDVIVEEQVSYLTTYNWEYINLSKCRRWMERNWMVSVYASVAYICVIFLLQAWMKNRPAYKLRKPLVVWNIMLAVFSIFGFLRTAPEIIYINMEYGFHLIICASYGLQYSPFKTSLINFWKIILFQQFFSYCTPKTGGIIIMQLLSGVG